MAKHKYHKNNVSPLEEFHEEKQEICMEEQQQEKQAMECSHLEKMLKEQKRKRVLFYPYAASCIGVLVLILYLVIKGHCVVDLPLLIILAILTAVFLWIQLKENQRLCERVEDMLEERRHS